MKMLKICVIVLCASFSSAAIYAQNWPPPPPQQPQPPAEKGFDKNRLFVGGNFGLSFGDYTIVNISPQVGYKFNQYFAGGIGVNGQYYSVKYYDPIIDRAQYGVAGFNIFGRVYPIPQLFAQLQPELNYTWGKTKYVRGEVSTNNSKIRPALLVGAGGIIPAGRSGIIIMIQYDLLGESNVPPYGNKPFYSFGINLGL